MSCALIVVYLYKNTLSLILDDMKLKNHKRMQDFLRVQKFELHLALREHVDYRRENEPVFNTLSALTSWYNKFRIFIHKYDKRTVILNNKGFGKDYVKYLESIGLGNTTIKQQFRTLVATLNRLDIYHDFNQKELFRGYARESKANEDFFLKDEEVRQLLDIKIKLSEGERLILDKFIISCFTGCRRSEIPSVEILDSKRLRYTSIKTKKDVLVPFNEVVKPYIERGLYKTKMTNFENMNQNAALHEIFKRLNWNDKVRKYRLHKESKIAYDVPRYMAITFHSGRKFFGKMLLDKDLSLFKVSQLLGHSSVKTTQDYYAAVTREKMMDDANDLINKF